MLTDKDFRKETLDYCQDVTVLQFWKHEFGQWNEKQVNESIAPVLNKVGAFTANPIIRNIIGQPKSSFDVRKIMDEGKILVVNLSKGLIGEDNAAILGAFLVTKVQLAAMSRSDIPNVADRRPFYLYVDEFQNFATDSFAVILSEARKYGLNLTVANQYISQMTDSVRDAVFGNVGTTISFRVSADDAPILAKQFEPTFDESDLIQMNNRHFIISMIINGEKVPAFSATTLSLPETPQDNFDAIVESSRRLYARNRAEVEAEIRETIEQSEKYKKELSDSGRLDPAVTDQIRQSYTTRPAGHEKPVFSFTPTPQSDFRKLKLSPNAAEGKQRPGLKDLGALAAQAAQKPEKPALPATKTPSQAPEDHVKPAQTRVEAPERHPQPQAESDSAKAPEAPQRASGEPTAENAPKPRNRRKRHKHPNRAKAPQKPVETPVSSHSAPTAPQTRTPAPQAPAAPQTPKSTTPSQPHAAQSKPEIIHDGQELRIRH